MERLDFTILKISPVTLYWKSEIWERHIGWFGRNGYKIVRLDAEKWTTAAHFHQDIADSLQFPDYYGMNLDALNDCLSNIDFSRYEGVVLAFQHYDRFSQKFQDTAQIILDIIAGNAWTHLLFGNRLVALVQTDQADATFKHVGGKPVAWNSDEWLNLNRGQ